MLRHDPDNDAESQPKVDAWRFLLGGLEVIGRALLPPPSFDCNETERDFRAHHARQTAPARRAGVVLALFTWVAYSAVDYVNVGPGSGAETLYPEILSLRVVGTVVMATGAYFSFRPKFMEDVYSRLILFIFVGLCYLILLGMVSDIEFPFSYLVDYPGLILYLMFVLGLFRIDAKTFVAFIATVLPLSAYELHSGNTASIRNLVHSPSQDLFTPLTVFFNYYYMMAMLYLTSSMFIGYVIACQLERNARVTFLRERELERSNRALTDSRRDVENRTLALVAAKEELRTSAEQANLDKSRFLADAVHDLSQPTQAVSLLAESARLALARNDFGRAGSLIEMTSRAAQIARSSFQAVLEISRLESGLVKPVLTAFDVQDVVTEVLAPLRVIAEARGVRMRVRATRVDRPMVRSDRALLARALANLAANAVKYSDPDKGMRQTILIGVVPLPNRVRIDVVDNGIGIPKSKWGEVFRPFVQLHNPDHNREKGLGLGLSIVNAIFNMLPEHRLDMRSEEGRGTRFSLEVPRFSGWLAPASDLGGTVRPMADLSSLFAWYVEDDEIARMATTALLEELGVLTECAASFDELERELPFTERRPDLVITDYRLPGGHTADDVIALFTRRWDMDIPVMVLTGEAAPKNTEALGVNARVLKKPASPEEIIDAITLLCFRKPHAPAGEE